MAEEKNVFQKYTDAETFAKIVDFKNMAEMWENSVKTYPNNVAIVDGIDMENPVTFAQLDEKVSHFRTVLKNAGVKQGDKVAIYSPNSIGFAKAFLAITTLGATAALLPPHLDAMSVMGCSMMFSLSAIVYDESLFENLSIVSAKNPAVKLINVNETAENATESVDVDSDAPCAILFTGGTTGKSKGALLSHRAILRGTKNGCYGLEKVFEQRYFLVLPLTHVFGLIRNLLSSFYTGSAIFICRNNKNMFREIAIFKPTIMVLVPALAEMALGLSRQFGRNMLGEDLKYIICGASAVAPYLVHEYHKMGIALFPGYGLTESANLVSGNPEALTKADSVGYIYPGMDYKVVDGELWLKGVNMMDGYVASEENATAYCDGYFRTGDLVRIDDEGFLYITGRLKEVIVLPSGENVSPAEIETNFYAIDSIQDCLVYEENGTLAIQILPRAAVLATLGVNDPLAYYKEKTEEINAKLPSFARINKVVIRDTDFARSPSMKIVRNQK